MHLVNGCPKLARNSTKEDMTMLPEEFVGNCAKSMDWKAQTGGMSIPPDGMENNKVELYWDLTFQTDMTVAQNRPYILS